MLLAAWVDQAEKATLTLEHFVADYNVNHSQPPANCHVSALDLLTLRSGAKLNDAVLTAALASLCSSVPGNAVTYAIPSYSIIKNTTAQLKRALSSQAKKFVTAICHVSHWVGVFVDFSASECFVSNSLGPRHASTSNALHVIQSALHEVLPPLEPAGK